MVNLNIEETKAIKEFVRRLKDELKDNLVFIEMFGSKARGDFTPDSDIDLLIVVKHKDIRLVDRMYDILFAIDPYYNLKISLVIFSQLEYEENVRLNSPFIENIKREALRL